MPTSTNIENPEGQSLRLWEQSSGTETDAVLLVHGATYGTRAMFAPKDDGQRRFWFDAIADAGRAVFGIDVRGYGDSERPPELDRPADENQPVVRATQAAQDVKAALEHVNSRFDTVHLVGLSWGTIICGVLASGETPSIDSLTLYAPVYELPNSVASRFDPGDPPAAYREVTKAEARARWDEQVPPDIDPAVWRGGSESSDPLFEAMWRGAYESGQGVTEPDEQTIRIPNGTLLDLQAAARGEPVYDPTEIDVPTMVVRGSQDPTSVRDDALAVFDVVSSDHVEYLEIDGGTHFLHLEPKRQTLYESVNAFHSRSSRL